MRKPLKMDCFKVMLDIGAPIESIVDIGVQSSTAELLLAFKDRKQYLIEPVIEWNPKIRSIYDQYGVDYILINVAASDFEVL
jgi:hypothetical protein